MIHSHLVYDWVTFLADVNPPTVWILHEFVHVRRRGARQSIVVEAVEILVKLRRTFVPLVCLLACEKVVVHKHCTESPLVVSIRTRHLARAWHLWELVAVVVIEFLGRQILFIDVPNRFLRRLIP